MKDKKRLWVIILFHMLYVELYAQQIETIVDSSYKWSTLSAYTRMHYKQVLSPDNYSRFLKTLSSITLIDVPYYGYDAKVHRGQILCHKEVANDIKKIFNQLIWIKFPIYSAKPISDFDFNDKLSMQNNNTTAFDFRLKTLKNGWSNHAFGKAIDINPMQNPFVTRTGSKHPYNALDFIEQGRISLKDEKGKRVVQIFKLYGWSWGGVWRRGKDYQHFEKL